jgi:hypothetical protein
MPPVRMRPYSFWRDGEEVLAFLDHIIRGFPMTRPVCAAALALTLFLAPVAAAAASFLFSLEIDFVVDEESDGLILGDPSLLTPQLDGNPFATETASGSGNASVTLEFGPASGTPGSLFTFTARGTGMTSPFGLGTAEAGLALNQRLVLFNDGEAPVVLPFFLDWTLTVEASGGDWGDSSALLSFAGFNFGSADGEFGGGPLSVDSLSGDGRLVASGATAGTFDLAASGFGEVEVVASGSGSARTVAPIPLPAGAWLLLSGLGALVLAGRAAASRRTGSARSGSGARRR